MAAFWPGDRYCTSTSCPRCGYTWSGGTPSITYIPECTFGSGTWRFDYEPPPKPSAKELRRLRNAQLQAMAKERIERAPRELVALNAGMHLRQMRRSMGLARARTS